MTKKSKQIHDIKIEQIYPNPNQPRKTFSEESLKELADSIKQFGVIQPIVVRKMDSELYELVSGERRMRASILAGKDTIPAVLTKMTDQDSAIIAIIENIQREDLSYFDEAESYRVLMDQYHLTQNEVAEMLGKSQAFVANKTRLLKLDPDIIAAAKENKLSERHARVLLRVPDKDLQMEIIKKIEKQGLTVKKTEELVEKVRNEVMTNNYDEPITKEKKARVKSFINAQIYINTIKSAFATIQNLKKDAQYKEFDLGDEVEIRITIPK